MVIPILLFALRVLSNEISVYRVKKKYVRYLFATADVCCFDSKSEAIFAAKSPATTNCCEWVPLYYTKMSVCRLLVIVVDGVSQIWFEWWWSGVCVYFSWPKKKRFLAEPHGWWENRRLIAFNFRWWSKLQTKPLHWVLFSIMIVWFIKECSSSYHSKPISWRPQHCFKWTMKTNRSIGRAKANKK